MMSGQWNLPLMSRRPGYYPERLIVQPKLCQGMTSAVPQRFPPPGAHILGMLRMVGFAPT